MVAVEAEILGYVAESVGFLLTPVRDKMGSSERGYSRCETASWGGNLQGIEWTCVLCSHHVTSFLQRGLPVMNLFGTCLGSSRA